MEHKVALAILVNLAHRYRSARRCYNRCKRNNPEAKQHIDFLYGVQIEAWNAFQASKAVYREETL
jgi:hypothetical protein